MAPIRSFLRISVVTLGLVALVSAAHAQVNADAARALAQKSNCLACHKMEDKGVGPALRDISKKYQGVDGVQDKLAAELRKGSKGTWGTVAMPAVGKAVSDEDLNTIVAWILSQPPR